MAYDTYNFPDHIKGDTFSGTSFHIDVNGSDLNLSGATIEAEFKRSLTEDRQTLSTTNGAITITDATGGDFEIDEQIINWEPDTYTYDIEIILSGGETRTWIQGSWTILRDTTNG